MLMRMLPTLQLLPVLDPHDRHLLSVYMATCYDLIRLGLGPVPEPCLAWSDPRVFQPRHVMQRDASRDPVPPHVSVCLHALTCECVAPEGPCTSLAYNPCSQFRIYILPCTLRLGFTTDILWVHFSDTIPPPVNTVTVVGEGMTPYMFGTVLYQKI